jgi:hypothetical protein
MSLTASDNPIATGVRYAIDADDNICFVDGGWAQFAETNDGLELLQASIIGKPLWNYISDETTRSLYQQMVARVREGRSAQFSLRCDGPDCRRLLEMTISAGANGTVEFATRTLRLDHRAPVALLSRQVPRSSDLLRVCAWCNRVDAGSGTGQWVEVEDAIDSLRLFELPLPPQLTHGICETCFAAMSKTIQNLNT